VRLRALRDGDRDAIERVLLGTGAFRPDEIAVAMDLIDIGLTPGGGGYLFVVAELDGDVAGYACFGATPCTLGTFDLYWIAVDKRLHGSGIGRTLVAHVEERVREAAGRMILIETGGKPSYSAQRGFYLSAGYREVARVPDFYEQGDDRVIYAKKLS
jgi:ribosomal protein S18 acetylase RimI-like enzyme